MHFAVLYICMHICNWTLVVNLHYELVLVVQDEREVLPSNPEATGAATTVATPAAHGIEVAVEFKPVEHPTEPLDNDRPVQCPLPEPSILNVSLKIISISKILCIYIFVCLSVYI